MAKEIAKLFITLGIDDKEYNAKLNQLNKSLGTVGKTMAVAGAAIVAGLALSVKSFAETAHQVEIMSEKTGLSTTAVQQYGYAADVTGSSIDDLGTGIKRMQVLITNAGEGTKTANDTLKNLGLTIDDLKGKSPDEQFQTLASAIAGIEDPTARAAAAVAVFGRSGTDILPMLANGTEGLKKLTDAAVVMSESEVTAGYNLQNSITQTQANIKGLVNSIGASVAPAFETFTSVIGAAAKGIRDFAEAHPEISGMLGDLALSFGSVIFVLGSINFAIKGIIKLFNELSTVTKLTAGSLGALTFGLTAVVTSIIYLVGKLQEKQKFEEAELTLTEERTKAMKGLANEYEKATNEYYNLLEEQLQLSKSSFLNIDELLHPGRIKRIQELIDQTKAELATEKQLTDAKEADATVTQELTDKLTSMINKAENANTTAGELGVTVQDIADYLVKAGQGAEIFGLDWYSIGDDANMMAQALGLSLEDVARATGKLKDQTLELDQQIQDIIKQYDFEQSAAGKLHLTVDDVIGALHGAGVASGWLEDAIGSLGDKSKDVNAILEKFGLSAADIAGFLAGDISASEIFHKIATGENIPASAIGGTEIPGFDFGGIVPGPIGAPVPAIVHGGEIISQPGQDGTRSQASIDKMVADAIQRGLAGIKIRVEVGGREVAAIVSKEQYHMRQLRT